METKEYFEKVMQDYNQHRKGRNLRKYCSDECIDYKWLFDYKKSYGSCKPSAKEADSNSSFIPLQIIEERCCVSKSESVETSWCIKQLVLSTPLGDDIEIRSKNMAAHRIPREQVILLTSNAVQSKMYIYEPDESRESLRLEGDKEVFG